MKQPLPKPTKAFLLILLLFASISSSKGQDISTEGTDFWLGFMPHINLSDLELSIFISANDSTDGVISIPGAADQNFTVLPNQTTEIPISPTFWPTVVSSDRNIALEKAIHITTDNPVSVYALNKREIYSADATIVLPTISLGKTYYAIAHTDGTFNANGNLYNSLPSTILIVGVADNTNIQITPTAPLLSGGGSTNTPFTISLDQGETYLIQSIGNLTGTKIETIGGTANDCQNFAVFSGSERSYVGQCGAGQDHLIQQMYPLKSWGSEFSFVSYQNRTGGDLVKVVASEHNTTVNITGESPFLLNEGQSIELLLDGVRTISANNPINVAQFSRSADCDGSFGDPFMIGLSPNQQLLNQITFSAFPVFSPNDFVYYVDIITPTDGVDIIELDSMNISSEFQVIPSNPDFSYAQIASLDTGNHFIQSDSGFIAYVYGFGLGSNAYESFGYVTGASLANVNYTIFSVDSGQVDIGNTADLCLGNVIDFSSDVDDQFQVFQWDMGDGTIYTTQNVEHTYTQTGVYNVTLIASTNSGDCGTQESISKTVIVQTPEYEILGPRSVCPNTFELDYAIIDAGADDYTFVWEISGGEIVSGQNTDSIKVNWFGTNPSAYVRVTTTNNLGCSNTKTFNVEIETALSPQAPIGPDTVCINSLTQTYEAVFANGNEYEWFIEGGDMVVDADNPNGNTVTVTWDTMATEWKLWFHESNILDMICEGTSDTFFLQAILDEVILDFDISPISCYGDTNGIITVLPSGGSGTYAIIWQQDTSLTMPTLSDLGPGIYEVEVQDTLGCVTTAEIELTEPDSLVLDDASIDVLCFGDSTGTIDIDVSGGTTPYQYTWNTSSLDTAVLDQIPAGAYQVTVTDSNGCAITSDTILITQPDSMQFEVVGPDSVCQFTTKDYTITDDEDDTYTWIVDGGSITSGQGTKNVTIAWDTLNANASIKIVAQNSDGCISDTLVYPIEIFQLAQPALPSGADTLCFFDTLSIPYAAELNADYTYHWFIEGGTFQQINNHEVVVDWTLEGTHQLWYQVVVTDDPDCIAYSDTIDVTILTFDNTAPEISSSINTSDTIYCDTLYLGQSLSFEIEGTDINNDWLTLVAQGQGFDITDYGMVFNETQGTGTVNQTFTFDVNCDASTFPNPTQTTEELFIDFIVSDSVGCLITSSDTITFKVILIKEYIPNDAPTIRTDIADFDATTNTYTINATVGNTITFNVFGEDINATDNISVVATVDGGSTLADLNMNFTNLSGVSPQNGVFTWEIACDQFDLSNTYTLRFTVADEENECGIADTETATVIINLQDIEAGSFDPPNAFSPNGDGIGDEYYISNLPLDNCADQFSSIKIYNRWGKTVFESNDRNFKWDGLNVPAGVYFCEVHYENNTYKVQLVVLK